MKKDVAGGMGWIVVAALTSDIRRGRADTAPFSFSSSSSLTKPSSSSSANQMCSEKKFFLGSSDLFGFFFFSMHLQTTLGVVREKFLWTTSTNYEQRYNRQRGETPQKYFLWLPSGLQLFTALYCLTVATTKKVACNGCCRNLLVRVRENEESAGLWNRFFALLHADFRQATRSSAHRLHFLIVLLVILLVCCLRHLNSERINV